MLMDKFMNAIDPRSSRSQSLDLRDGSGPFESLLLLPGLLLALLIGAGGA